MPERTFATQAIATLLTLVGISGSYISKTSAQEIPKAQCLSDYGMVRCGYNCVADYGVVNCADWAGGFCRADYGKVVCGPPAPPNWLNAYSNRNSSNNSGLGVRGAWAVTLGRWSGVLRMNGSAGHLVLVSNSTELVEQRMMLKRNSNGGYVLDGEIATWYNLSRKYYADNIYLQKFSKSFSARSCDDNRSCSTVTLTYVGN